MALERFLGYHFTPTSVLIAEAFHSRADQLEWEIFKQPNYELPPEWLALYKEAIPNLYDTHLQVFGFQALPAIWTGLTKGRFHRYDSEFFRTVSPKDKSAVSELARFLKYSLVYHVKPQPDEQLHVTLVTEDLGDEELSAVLSTLQQSVNLPNVTFVSAISPQEAVLRYLWYRPATPSSAPITEQSILVVHIGYVFTEFTLWINGSPEAPIRVQGMRQIDMGVCRYLTEHHELARTLDIGDLVIYAQRARADYEPGQERIPIFEHDREWVEMPESDYLALIQEGADDITRRLNRAMRAQGNGFHQVIITGEGAAFGPVVGQLRNAMSALSLPEPIVLSHSAVSCAQGAAGLSYEVRTSLREAQ